MDGGRLPVSEVGGSSMLFFGWLALVILTAIAANSKNRSVFIGVLVGAAFPLLGLIGYLIVKPLPSKAGSIRKGLLVNSNDERQCPHCAELIKMQATKCRFCSEDVSPISENEARSARVEVYEPIERKRTLIILVTILAVAAIAFFNQ